MADFLHLTGRKKGTHWMKFGGQPLHDDDFLPWDVATTANLIHIGRVDVLGRLCGGMDDARAAFLCPCLRRPRSATGDAGDGTPTASPITITDDPAPPDEAVTPSPAPTGMALSPAPPVPTAATDHTDGVAEEKIGERSDAAGVTVHTNEDEEEDGEDAVVRDAPLCGEKPNAEMIDLALEAPAPILDLSEAPAPPPAVEKVDDSDPYHGSLRVMWSDKHGSYFEGIGHGVYHAGHSEEESAEGAADTKELKYPDGFVITHDGKQVCEIERRLGQGAMGTVYLGKLPDGSRCAVKALREDKVGAERITMEKELAVETSIGIALARHPLIASAIGAVVPLPGVETTAKGLLLLCDLVDAGDLEEAMSTKAAVAKLSPDYAGTLWDDERWTLVSIMIQMFLGFEHIHKRGIIHQVRSRAAPPRGKLLGEILSS